MKIINSIIGKTIKEVRIMSFYMNFKLVCDVLSVYVKVDTCDWYRFTTSDGDNIIEIMEEEPIELTLNEIEDEFAYPIKTVNFAYIDKKIKEIYKYTYVNNEDELNGFYIELNDYSGFSLFEEDDCIKIFDGIKLNEEYSLIRYSKSSSSSS